MFTGAQGKDFCTDTWAEADFTVVKTDLRQMRKHKACMKHDGSMATDIQKRVRLLYSFIVWSITIDMWRALQYHSDGQY